MRGQAQTSFLSYSVCVKAIRVILCRDARLGRRSSVRPSPINDTSPCRDARSVRPLCQKLQHRGFNGDGRTDRVSLQDDVEVRTRWGRTPPARYFRASLQESSPLRPSHVTGFIGLLDVREASGESAVLLWAM